MPERLRQSEPDRPDRRVEEPAVRSPVLRHEVLALQVAAGKQGGAEAKAELDWDEKTIALDTKVGPIGLGGKIGMGKAGRRRLGNHPSPPSRWQPGDSVVQDHLKDDQEGHRAAEQAQRRKRRLLRHQRLRRRSGRQGRGQPDLALPSRHPSSPDCLASMGR